MKNIVYPWNNDFNLSSYLAQASIHSWQFHMTDLLINIFQISRRIWQVPSCLCFAVQLSGLNLTFLLWLLCFFSCATVCPDDFPPEGSPSPDISMVSFSPLLWGRKERTTSWLRGLQLNWFCTKGHLRTYSFAHWRPYLPWQLFLLHLQYLLTIHPQFAFLKICKPKKSCYRGYSIQKQEREDFQIFTGSFILCKCWLLATSLKI